MKTFSALILFISLTLSSWAQNYPRVDKIVHDYPSSFNNIDELANRINTDFNLDEEKVRALYNWLAINIRYNYKKDLFFDISKTRMIYFNDYDKQSQLKRRQLKRLEKILRTKKAVCIDYSNLFKEVCTRIGIVSEVVKGHSKVSVYDIDSENKVKNHAWNVVKIRGKWKLIDVTWATVFISEKFKKISKKYYDYYFFTDPNELILTHFPANKKWQLVDSKISKSAFFKSPLFYTNYFIDEFKISNFQNGVIQVNKKRLIIHFDSIPKNKSIVYTIEGDDNLKPLQFRKVKKGNYKSSIRYGKSDNSSLTIYADKLPIVSFRINQPLKK